MSCCHVFARPDGRRQRSHPGRARQARKRRYGRPPVDVSLQVHRQLHLHGLRAWFFDRLWSQGVSPAFAPDWPGRRALPLTTRPVLSSTGRAFDAGRSYAKRYYKLVKHDLTWVRASDQERVVDSARFFMHVRPLFFSAHAHFDTDFSRLLYRASLAAHLSWEMSQFSRK